ncbi:RN182 ligase, partial [Trogon melanurus]|nr:RN182 ligase [Trogon melanurus]
LKMNYPCTEGEENVPNDELECKICYQKFTVHSHKPKILDCLHRICAKCLTKILHTGNGSPWVSCPFCRHETELHEGEFEGLPADMNIMSKLMLRNKTAWNFACKEVVLTPKNLASSNSSHGSSNCLVITIMEVQGDSPRTSSWSLASDDYGGHGTDSVFQSQLDQDLISKLCEHLPRVLIWLLVFLYFSSLPLGIYLLVIQKVALGVACVTFVPSSLAICLLYTFCQCLCHGICDCSSQ